ncbi:MAG: hypothetical protein ABGX04_03540 [Myxococcales bacterium]|nr:hypothetical protein [Myxococcales bacterium]HIK84030.1 hypothetical protein [Myxococcales bacterium]
MKSDSIEFGEISHTSFEGLDHAPFGEAARCIQSRMLGGLEMKLDEGFVVLDAAAESRAMWSIWEDT